MLQTSVTEHFETTPIIQLYLQHLLKTDVTTDEDRT